MLIEVGQLLPHPKDVLCKLGDSCDCRDASILPLLLDAQLRNQADRCHISASDRLDLINCPEPLVAEQLIEVGNDLVEESDTLDTLVVPVQLCVELVEVGDACKDHPHPRVRLAVQLLE